MPSIHKTLIDAVASKLASLSLTGFSSDNIFTRKLPTDRTGAIAAALDHEGCAIVVSLPGQVAAEGTTTAQNAWGYPCRVSFVWPSNQNLELNDDELLAFETARNAFHMKTLSGASTVVYCRVENIEAVVPSLFWSNNVTVAEFLVRPISYETRP